MIESKEDLYKLQYDGSFVNIETGDIINIDQRKYVMYPEKQKMIKEPFGIVFLNRMKDLSKDKELRGIPSAIIIYLIGVLDFENKLAISQVEMANELSINKVNVNQAIKKLLNKEIIFKETKVAGVQFYRLNAEYFWRGSLNKLKREKDEIKLRKIIEKHDKKAHLKNNQPIT